MCHPHLGTGGAIFTPSSSCSPAGQSHTQHEGVRDGLLATSSPCPCCCSVEASRIDTYTKSTSITPRIASRCNPPTSASFSHPSFLLPIIHVARRLSAVDRSLGARRTAEERCLGGGRDYQRCKYWGMAFDRAMVSGQKSCANVL